MSEAERRRFLANILADAERLGALVGRLRELARADAPPVIGEAALGPAIAALRLAVPGLTIELRGEETLAVPMSAENLGIVLSHLADNARRHGADRLDIAAHRDADGLSLRIADDGSGIQPANRERIFEAFFTTRREEGGTGMGLAIVRALVERHGGTIALDEAARGASFVIRLP